MSASVAAVEFYNTNLDNYFITADANEAAQIDGGSAGAGWIRTGNTFESGGNTSVCRFYGSQSPGPNSHFYTVDSAECQGLADQQIPAGDPRKLTVKSWNFESFDFVSTPPTNGSCPGGTVPVYRAYNNGFSRGVDSNHRITSNLTSIQQQVACGWSNEGVVMCAPSGTSSGGTTSCNSTPTLVEGICGSSNGGSFTSIPTANLCSSGSASSATGSGPWYWSCSGSNGGASAPCSANYDQVASSPEGFWTGLTSNGYTANIAVLENGETWGVYGANGTLYGVLYGVTGSSGNTLSGLGYEFYIPSHQVSSTSYSGTFSTKDSISINTPSGVSFNGTYSSKYDQPASLSTLSGSYSGWGVGLGVTGTTSAQSASVSISPSGSFASYSPGCNATGTATPRASGKNIFNVSVTFTGAHCALGNGAVTTGIANYDSSTGQLMLMALIGGKTDGFIYLAQKQ
jgi:hypothetical protein